MQGQCQICKGMFEIQPEWIGLQAQCPHCKQTIVVQDAQQQAPQMNAQQCLMGQPIAYQYQSMPSKSNNENKSTGSLVCGIISLCYWNLITPYINDTIFSIENWSKVFWCLLLSVIGLILGCNKKYKTGIILNIIALILTILNALSFLYIKLIK